LPQANITGLDIFTGQKKQDIAPTSHNMEAPFVHVTNLQLVDITDEGFCSLMDEAGETRDDLRLPDDKSPDMELGPRIKKAFESNKEVTCIITRAMDQEVVRRTKIRCPTVKRGTNTADATQITDFREADGQFFSRFPGGYQVWLFCSALLSCADSCS
jgi:translation initiation factor 5A